MSTYIINLYNYLEGKYVSYINNFFLTIGGVNKTFNLHTKKVTFAVIEPSFFNITFRVFDNIKEIFLFKIIFKFILSIPHFILENFIGKSLFNLIICWTAVGSEPVSRLFCLCLIVEYFLFLLSLGYFLRLNGVYQYCIDNYGEEFVEIHIDNPLSATHFRMAQRCGLVGAGIMGLNMADHSYSSHQEFNEIELKIKILKDNDLGISKEDVFKIFAEAKAGNKPLSDTVIQPIVELIKGSKK